MDILNNQLTPFSKDIMSDMASFPNTAVANSSSGISFENYLKAVNDSIEQQERRERNDYNSRKEYQKDPYIERKEPYMKDRYNEDTSRSGGFASADNHNKPTNKPIFDINDQRSSVASNNYNNNNNNNRPATQEYNKVEKNPIQIGNIYQNRSKDKSLGELDSAGVSNDRSSTENLSIASLAYKIHSLLNVENTGDELLLSSESSLDSMSMKDLLSIISGMSQEDLDALNKLVDADNAGISDLELSNLGEIEDLIVTAQQNGIGSGAKTDSNKEVDAGLPIVSDKSGLLDEQDIINFYQSNNKTEKTSNDTILVESLKANRDMLLTDGNVVSADVILSGSKNKDINKIDTSILDLIKQVSSKDNDEESLLDLIKKIAGDIDTEELSDNSKKVAQADIKDMSLSNVSEEILTEEVVSKDVELKDSKTLSFDDLIKVINADTSKNIPATAQEVLVDSESAKVEDVEAVVSPIVEEEALTTPLTKNEIVTTLEDALNRLTKSNIAEEDQNVSSNDEVTKEPVKKVDFTAAPVNSKEVNSKADKAFMITEEENKIIDAMKKSLFTENNKSDEGKSDDIENSKMVSKASADGSLSDLNKDALVVASSQSKDFKDVLTQDLSEENLESEIDTELEFVSKDLSQEEDNDPSNNPSGKGNKLLEEVEDTYSSDSLTVEESVVADSSDNENPSFKLNEQATKNIDKVDLSKQSQSNAGTSNSNGSTKNDNFVNNFNNQMTEKTAENPKNVAQQRGNSVPIYDLKNSSDIGKLVKSIDQSVLKGESKLTVNLYPEHLGKLEIQLAEVAGKMTAKFITESEGAHKIMMSQTEALRNHLSEKGIVVDNMEFRFDDSNRQQQQQQQQQAESERRSAAKNAMNRKNESKDSSLERDNNINFRAKAKPGIYA